MLAIQTLRYVRLLILVVDVGTTVLKDAFHILLKSTSAGCNVDFLLSKHKTDIKSLLEQGSIHLYQFRILFPQNNQTNMDDWDVSLYCFVMLICFSIEGKCKKILDVLLCEAKVTRHNQKGMQVFLNRKQMEIDNLRKDRVITDDQYNSIFPAVGTACIQSWDITLVIVLSLHLCENQESKLTVALREIVYREISLFHNNLNDFLKCNKTRIDDLRHKWKLTDTEYIQMFPENKSDADIDTLPASVLCLIIVELGKSVSAEKIEKVRVIRNSLVHNKAPKVDEEMYSDCCKTLKECFEGFVLDGSNLMIQHLCDDILNLQFADKESVDERIKRLYYGGHLGPNFPENLENIVQRFEISLNDTKKDMKSSFQDVEKKITSSGDEVKRCVRTLENTLQGNKRDTDQQLVAMEERIIKCILSSKEKNIPLPIPDSELEVDVYANCDNPADELQAEQVYVDATNNTIQQKESTVQDSEIEESIQKFHETFQTCDMEPKRAVQECIMIFMRWKSLEGLLRLIKLYRNGDLQKSLDHIAIELQKKMHKSVRLKIDIRPRFIEEILVSIEKALGPFNTTIKGSAKLVLKCRSMTGLADVVSMYRTGKVAESLEKVSTSISKKIGALITFKTSINKMSLERVLKAAGIADADECKTGTGGFPHKCSKSPRSTRCVLISRILNRDFTSNNEEDIGIADADECKTGTGGFPHKCSEFPRSTRCVLISRNLNRDFTSNNEEDIDDVIPNEIQKLEVLKQLYIDPSCEIKAMHKLHSITIVGNTDVGKSYFANSIFGVTSNTDETIENMTSGHTCSVKTPCTYCAIFNDCRRTSCDECCRNCRNNVVRVKTSSQNTDVNAISSCCLNKIVYIWDFGGQNNSYSTQQVFFNSNAIYILVHDITKELHEDDNEKDYAKFAKICLNCIQYLANTANRQPQVLLIGIHIDKWDLNTEQNENTNRAVQCSCLIPFISVKESLFNISQPIGCTIKDELRNYIIEITETSLATEIPRKLIAWENTLMLIRHKKHITLENLCVSYLNALTAGDKAHVLVFLKYHHECGSIIYFDEPELSESVVLDPSWIINAAKSIKPYQSILEQKDIEGIWKTNSEEDFFEHSDILFLYLKKVGFLSKAKLFNLQTRHIQDGHVLIVPNLLENEKDLSIDQAYLNSTRTATALVYKFENEHVLPILYTAITAKALNTWPVVESEGIRFLDRNIGYYQLDSSSTGVIEMTKTHLQIYVLNLFGDAVDTRKCDQLRRFVEATLKQNHSNGRYKVCIQCNIAVSESKTITDFESTNGFEIVCPDCESVHELNITTDVMQVWYPDDDTELDRTDKWLDNILSMNSLSLQLTERELIRLSNIISYDLETLAISLCLKDEELSGIKKCNRYSKTLQIYQVLCAWSRKEDPNATLRALLQTITKNSNLKVNWDQIKNMCENKF